MNISTLQVLAHLGNDWHSGQWSRGYRLMCLARKSLGRRQYYASLSLDLSPFTPRQQQLYNTLEKRYKDKL